MVSFGEEDDEGMAGSLCPFVARSRATASDSLLRWARGKLSCRSRIPIPYGPKILTTPAAFISSESSEPEAEIC